MKKIIFFMLAVSFLSCKKEVVKQTIYTVSFQVEKDEEASYYLQVHSGGLWINSISIPDSSLSGKYNIDIPLNKNDQVRIAAKTKNDTLFYSKVLLAQ